MCICKVSRLALGEPVNYHYASDVLGEAISAWNECIESLRTRAQNPEHLLELLDRECDSSMDDANIQQAMVTVQERISQLKTIRVTMSSHGVLILGLYIGWCVTRLHCFYICLHILYCI